MSLVVCENLTISYKETLAVDSISFKIYPKDYLVILGENGSGKSTLLKGILGIKSKNKGRILFNNLKRSDIGYMPQKSSIKRDLPASVFEVVLSGFVGNLGFFSFFGSEKIEKAKEILDFLGLIDIKNRSFQDLSKGQQQKVLLARAVVAAKKILFLDEPCASLDPVFVRQFYGFIKTLNEEKNMAIVMVSHDVDVAVLNAKNILHMKNKLLFFGDVDGYVKTNMARRFLKGE